MGRKSVKSKEKKMKRKVEDAMTAVKQATVDAANDLKNPMGLLPAFTKFERNGLKLSINFYRVPDMDEDTKDWAFKLTRTNMQALYEESSWGWSDKQKRDEMMDEKACYLIARDDQNSPVAMIHFRFDMDCNDAVLYCYEIQLVKSVRRNGLGKFLMQILELLAHKTQMTKVMLTVCKKNPDAHKFFLSTLKYEVDETSPEESMVEALFEDEGYSYQILSKPIGPARVPEHTHCAHGCAHC